MIALSGRGTMTRPRTFLIGAIAVASLATTGSLLAQTAQPPQSARPNTNVVIVNPIPVPVKVDATTPIPVSGSVSVTNSQSLPVNATLVGQAGAVLVREARQGIMVRKWRPDSSCWEDLFYTVPAGKAFVLEHVNCIAAGDAGAEMTVTINIGDVLYETLVFQVPVVNSVTKLNVTNFIADSSPRLYFAAGDGVSLFMCTGTLPAASSCTISGYTVDAD